LTPARACCALHRHAIASARSQRTPHRTGALGANARLLLAGCALVATGIAALPAQAQVSASIGIESDYRFRGRTLSDGRPVVTADVGYDDQSGFYLGAAATAVVTGDDVGVLNVQGNIGFAKRVTPSLTLDVGVLRSQYTTRLRWRAVHYTEFYAGLSSHGFSTRVYYSPDYLARDVGTLYGELDYAMSPADKWQLSAHAGKMVFVANRPPLAPRLGNYDWRVGVSRQLGRFTARATLVGGGPGQEYYGGKLHKRVALVGGGSFAF